MENEQSAYLVQGDGAIYDILTEELLAFFHQFEQAGATQEQAVLSDERAVYEFLQATRSAMHTSKRRGPSTQNV